MAVGHVRGMVVNVDLPRLDATGGWKERPALIVSTEDFHRTRPEDLLVALITHRVWKYHGPTDYVLQDWSAAAHELALPFALGGALLSIADLHLLRRESQAVQESAEATIALSTREGFPYYVARATILRGWALAAQGQGEAGIAEIRQGLAAFEVQGMGTGLWIPCCLGLLAEAYGKAGQGDQGLTVVAEALEIAGRTGEREYEAELYRLRGELSLKSRSPESGVKNPPAPSVGGQSAPSTMLRTGICNPQLEAEAEECFHQAIALARQQEAKLFELRATVSLAHLWQRQGKRQEAHQMVAEVYGWFTEGFDTADLTEAKALLEEL